MTGAFYGTATFAAGEPDAIELTSLGESDGFVARFDAAGGLSWVERFGGAAHEFGLGAAVLPDDAVMVVGLYRGEATFGAGEAGETVLALHPYASESGFVARFGPSGRLSWAESFGGTSYARAHAAGLDPVTGELVVGGLVSGPGVATFPGAVPIVIDPINAEGYLARWDVDGGVRSIVTFGGFPEALDVAPDGAVIVSGDFAPEATFARGAPNETVLVTAANTDAFVARFLPDGALSWAAQTRSMPYTNTTGRGVAATLDGGAVMIGDFTERVELGTGEPAQVLLDTRGGYDPYIARFDAAGALVCAVQIAGNGSDIGVGVVRQADGTFVTTGDFDERVTLAPGTPSETEVIGGGGSDGFLATWLF